MANTRGMLGPFSLDPNQYEDEEAAEEKRLLGLAQSDPTQQLHYTGLSAARSLGRGLGQTAAVATGRDPRSNSERQQDAIRAASKAIADMGPMDDSTPAGVDKYYRGVMGILSQHGLSGEAHRAAQEWNKYKNEQADFQLKRDELDRKRKESEAKVANAAEANRIKAERNRQLATQGMPEFVQIVNAIENQSNPVQRKLMIDRANQMAGGKLVLEDAGDRVIVRNQRGDLLGVDMKGERPLTATERLAQGKADEKKNALGPAYQAAMVAAQTDYKAAADLYNHPGLDNLIGKWTGIAAERGTDKDGMMREAAISRLSPEGQEALALFQQVQGGAFVRALQDLKTAGGGSSGLGQVTEIEGQKITAAKGALFPRQQPASFRRKLADYIAVIEQSANILANKAQEDKLEPIHLDIVELTGPVRGAAPAPASTRPKASPRTAAPATSGDMIAVRRLSDGKLGRMPRSKFDSTKYEEIK